MRYKRKIYVKFTYVKFLIGYYYHKDKIGCHGKCCSTNMSCTQVRIINTKGSEQNVGWKHWNSYIISPCHRVELKLKGEISVVI